MIFIFVWACTQNTTLLEIQILSLDPYVVEFYWISLVLTMMMMCEYINVLSKFVICRIGRFWYKNPLLAPPIASGILFVCFFLLFAFILIIQHVYLTYIHKELMCACSYSWEKKAIDEALYKIDSFLFFFYSRIVCSSACFKNIFYWLNRKVLFEEGEMLLKGFSSMN